MKPLSVKRSLFPTAITLMVSVIIAIPFLIQTQESFSIYSFRFNPYALLSIFGLIADSVAVYLLVRRRTKTMDGIWLIIGNAGIILFALAETFQRLSAHPEAALFWAQFGGIGISFGAAAYFLFAVYYTMPEKSNAILTTSVLFGAAVISFFHANGDLIFSNDLNDVRLFPWGFNNQVGPAFIANFMWFASLTLLAVFLLLRYRSRTRNKIMRTQAAVFATAVFIPVAGGIIFDSLLPLLGIHFFPPMALPLFVINSMLILVGLWRYRVFELSPSILSQNILTTMSEAVIVTNEHLEIEFVNAETERLFQKDSHYLYSRRVTDIFNNSQPIEELWSNLLENKNFENIKPIEDLTITNGSEKHYLRILLSPVSRGASIEGFIFVISDITQLQQAFIDLETAKAGVERVVEERTKELREAQSKLLEMDKMKTEFIMLASHNLRTPLAAIRGYIDLLAMTLHEKTQEEAMNGLRISAKRLSDLTDDLLTISSIESADQPMEKKVIDAHEFLDEICKDTKDVAAATKNSFTVDLMVDKVQIQASNDRLRAAINNILDNAFKFTKEGEVIFAAKIDNAKLVIVVKDTGVGIAPEELDKLFTTFHRGTDTLTYNYDGEGLGLYLAKLIISEHAGTITVDSELDKGTKVTIELPVVKTKD